MNATKKSVKLDPIHPGEVLLEEFLKPMGISANRLAMEIHVAATRVSEITHGRRSITAETAIRLARYFRTTAEFWLRLQARYDLEAAEDKIAVQVRREVKPMPRSEAQTMVAVA
jgi:addiction module HigA family antidote